MTKLKTVLLSSAAFLIIEAGPAQAQQLAVEELVVTARKREERLQDIPLSITAFSSDDIKQAGFQDLDDILNQTSGVQFTGRAASSVGGRINSVIRIRGVTAASTQPQNQASSLFVDGVFALGGANVLPIQELERVEVIKGPQSAFFGRNTFAGAINYITKTPSVDEFSHEIDVSAGTYDQFDFNAYASGPIVEGKVAASLNARLYNHGAMWTATDGGGLGKESSKSISGVIYAEPTEALSIKLRAFYQEDDDGPPATAFMRAERENPTCLGKSYTGYNNMGVELTVPIGPYFCGAIPNPGEPGAPAISVNTNLKPQIFALPRRPFDGEFGGGFGPVQPSPNFLIEQYILRDPLIAGITDVPKLKGFGILRDTIRLSANIDYEFENGYQLVFTGGWNDVGTNYLLDFDRTDVESWWSADPQTGEDYSLEARIVSPTEERLSWVLGGTYYDQHWDTQGGGGLAIHASTFLDFTGATGPGNFTVPGRGLQDAKVWGVFGAVSYDLTDQITIDLEARYLQDERTTGLTAGTFTQQFSNTFKDWTPRVILSYQPTEDTNIYLSASRGQLPGQTNNAIVICSDQQFIEPYINILTGQPSTDSECDQIAAQLPNGELLKFTPSQKLDALELGLKQALLDGRIRFNAAGYYYKWKNLASGVRFTYVRDDDDPNKRDGIPKAFANTVGASVPGSQELYGLELESGFAITENWDAQLNVSWNKNKWTEFVFVSEFFTLPADNFKGKDQVRYPEWMGSLTTTYRGELTTDWDWYLRGDVSYQDKRWTEFSNLAQISDYFLTNARVGVEREDLRVEFYVLNVFNEDTWLSGGRGVDFAVLGDFFFRVQGIGLVPQEKRTFGIRTNVSF